MKSLAESKNLLVESLNDDLDRYLIAYEDIRTNVIVCVEIYPYSMPSTTVCEYSSLEEFKRNKTWHDWIRDGIKSDALKKMLK